MRLGIDFGTCFSSAAFIDGEKLTPIKDPIGASFIIPSSVFASAQKEIFVGQRAENMRLSDSRRYRGELKRDLGKTEPLLLGEHPYLPETLIAAILAKIKQDADTYMSRRGLPLCTGAVLTIPTTSQSFKHELMLKAATEAGFVEAELFLLQEPVAAAHYYARENKMTEGEILLVYDLGGGTFDAALLQKRGAGFEYLAQPSGIEYCGGVDFDRAIYNDLVQQNPALQDLLQGERTDKDALLTRIKLKEMCIELKHELSEPEAEEAEFSFVNAESGDFIQYCLQRSTFNRMIDPYVQETLTCCQQMLRHARITSDQISRILLVGGSCRIPYVQRLVQQEFGRPLVGTANLELVVCQGAAHYTTLHKISIVSGKPGEADYITINDALQEAEPGSRVAVRPGKYQEALILNRKVDLVGAGPKDQVIIEMSDTVGVQMATAEARIRGVTLRHTSPEALTWYKHGAVVIAHGRLTLENCIIEAQGHGVSIWGMGSEATLRGCCVQAGKNAGIAVNNGAFCEIEHCEITACRDAGVYVRDRGSKVKIRDCRVHDNAHLGISISAEGQGEIRGCDIAANAGAGIQLCDQGSAATISQSQVYEGKERGITLWQGAEVSLEDCKIFANMHAGLFVSGEGSRATLKGSQLYGGKYVGVDITEKGSASLEQCCVHGNAGAGILVKDAGSVVNVARCKVCEGAYAGIALLCRGSGFVSNTKVFKNLGPGVRVSNAGSRATIDTCDIRDNGVGIVVEDTGAVMVKDCTVEENRVDIYTEPGCAFRSATDKQGEDISLWQMPAKLEAPTPLPSFQPKSFKLVNELKVGGHTGQVNSIAISPYGQVLASASSDTTIKLWNLETGQLQRTLSDHRSTVRSVAISPDGRTLVSGGHDGVKVWDIRTGQLLRDLKDYKGFVRAVKISLEGQIVISGCDDAKIRLWNLYTGKLLQTLPGHEHYTYVTSIAVAPDGQTLVSGGSDQTIRLWDLNTGQWLRTFSEHGDSKHVRPVNAVAISLDGQMIISGSADTTIKLWNLHTGQLLDTLSGHNKDVTCLALSPDRQTLISGGLDKAIKFWSLYSGQGAYAQLPQKEDIRAVGISPDGQMLISGGADKTIKIWT